MTVYYDLHLHSCLSPCGDMDMTPNNLVNMAALQELDVIALSDHNTAGNLPAVRAVAEEVGILLIPAIEVCTNEEVHMLCLFETFEGCMAFSDLLYDLLPPIENQPEVFGEQVLMNAQDEPVGTLSKLLITAVNLSIDELLDRLPAYGGHAIPAHVDRSSYSIVSSLGFIPPDYEFKCVEVRHPPYDTKTDAFVITNSDAHYLENISGREHALEVHDKSIRGVLQALHLLGEEN